MAEQSTDEHDPEAGDTAAMAPGDQAPEGAPGAGEDICRRCGGSGRAGDATCPDCEGTGKVVDAIGGG